MYTLELDQPATPAPKARTGRPAWLVVAAALGVALTLGAGVAASAAVSHGTHLLPQRASAADARQACKTAIETDAQGRVARVNDGPDNGTYASLDSVDTDPAVATGGGYTVNGTEHFSVASILGAFPHAVLVVCTATPATGGTLSTVVDNR